MRFSGIWRDRLEVYIVYKNKKQEQKTKRNHYINHHTIPKKKKRQSLIVFWKFPSFGQASKQKVLGEKKHNSSDWNMFKLGEGDGYGWMGWDGERNTLGIDR